MGRRPTIQEVADALFDAVKSLECRTAHELELDTQTNDSMYRALERYRDDAWTWRR
jgi:hypothetical protein